MVSPRGSTFTAPLAGSIAPTRPRSVTKTSSPVHAGSTDTILSARAIVRVRS